MFIHEEMKDRMEKLVVLPFSIMGMGCTSQSSVAVLETSPRKSKQETNQSAIGVEGEESLSGPKMKNPLVFLPLPKPNMSFGLQKLLKSFKNLSQFFVYKDESEEMEMKMEIGFPTDVKHVTHIGWDGSTTNHHLKGWDNLQPREVVSIPTFSLRQFELAMAAQADAPVC